MIMVSRDRVELKWVVEVGFCSDGTGCCWLLLVVVIPVVIVVVVLPWGHSLTQ